MMPRPRLATLSAAASLLLGAAPTLHAQGGPMTPRPARFGLLAGANFADVMTDEDDGPNDRRTGLLLGGYLSKPLGTSMFAFRPEVLYSQKGAKASVNDDELDVDGEIQLDYLEVPLLLELSIPTTGGIRPQLYAGPALAFNVRCRVKASGGGASFSSSCDDLDEDSGVKTFDAGALVGGALAFDAGGTALSVGVRYTHGLTNIPKSGGGDVKNRVFAVYGSIEFPFGR